MNKLFKWNKEHLEFVKANVVGKQNSELVALFNNRFNVNVSIVQMQNFKKRNNLKSGVDCRFKKGSTPVNKGQKMSKEQYEICKATMFKKGLKPYNIKPIGTEVVVESSHDGYTYVKVDNQRGKRKANWKAKHHLIWEQHNGSIPKGHAIIFADGNKKNFNIDNLVCVTRRELAYLNKNHLIYNEADLTKVGVAIAKLNTQIYEKRKKK